MRAPASVPAGQDLAARQRVTALVFTRVAVTTELEDGYRLSFPRNESWRETLELFQAAWRRSCPHMTFEVLESQAEPLYSIEIRGPEGTKVWVENARHMLTSSLNPAPSLRHRVERAWRLATSPVRVLPDFLILGAKKCGTTALYSYLIEHPAITSALRKEVHFFDGRYGYGPLWYRSFFPTHASRWRGRLTGEATPDYLYHTFTAERIHSILPDVRLIALLRNPIDRAYSFYNHNLRAGLESLSFEEAIAAEPGRLEQDSPHPASNGFGFARNNFSYLARGRYVDQLKVWLEHFPPDQLLLLATEELHTDSEGTLRKTLDFLGLPYAAPAAFRRMNAAPYPAMNPATRAELSIRMQPDNERLYELVGRDFGWDS